MFNAVMPLLSSIGNLLAGMMKSKGNFVHSLILMLCLYHVMPGAPGVDMTVRPKCPVVDMGSIPIASTPRADRSATYAKKLTVKLATEHGWKGSQIRCLMVLWQRESNFRPDALNKHSGAGGIPQILGLRTKTAPRYQIQRGLSYITHRYRTPCAALAHHNQRGWY